MVSNSDIIKSISFNHAGFPGVAMNNNNNDDYDNDTVLEVRTVKLLYNNFYIAQFTCGDQQCSTGIIWIYIKYYKNKHNTNEIS